MAMIRVDFDEVMRFGDRHGDIGRALDSSRGVFRGDNNRLDMIIEAFGLSRGSHQFGGQTLGAAMGESDARAGRVANTFITSSSRYFQFANVNPDSSFDWRALFAGTGEIISYAAGFVGGKVADLGLKASLLGKAVTPFMRFLSPLFSFTTGALDLVSGTLEVIDTTLDLWDRVAGGLTLVSGIVTVAATGVAVVLTVAGVTTMGAAMLVISPFLIAGAAISLVAVAINYRNEIWSAMQTVGRGAADRAKAIARGVKEGAKNLLDGAKSVWNSTSNFVTSNVDAAVSTLKRGASNVLNGAEDLWNKVRQFGDSLADEVQDGVLLGAESMRTGLRDSIATLPWVALTPSPASRVSVGDVQAIGNIRQALDPGGWGVTRGDMRTISGTIKSLHPSDRNAVIAGLSDNEIERLRDQIRESRVKGGLSVEEQGDFYQLLVPHLDRVQLRRLLGSAAPQITHRTTMLPYPSTEDALRAAVVATGSPGRPAAGQIQIWRFHGDPPTSVVVMPGIEDLSGPLEKLKSGDLLAWRDFTGLSPNGSPRDMNYIRQVADGGDDVVGDEANRNAYVLALKAALVEAGIEPGTNLILAGHSGGAYTAAQMASDPAFNAQDGTPGSYRVVATVQAGAQSEWMVDKSMPWTSNVVIQNVFDAAVFGERIIGPAGGNAEEFIGGLKGAGHDPSNYERFLDTPRGRSLLASLGASTEGGPEIITVDIYDPYRLDLNAPPPDRSSAN